MSTPREAYDKAYQAYQDSLEATEAFKRASDAAYDAFIDAELEKEASS